MISMLIELVARLKKEKSDCEDAETFADFANFEDEVVSSQVQSEVKAGREMVVVENNTPDEGSEKIFATIVDVEEEGVSAIDSSGQMHFVEACNILASNYNIMKGDKVRSIVAVAF